MPRRKRAATLRDALRKVVVLTTLAALAGAALAWFAAHTAEDIRRNQEAAEARVLRELAGAPVPASSGDVLLCDQQLVILRSAGRGYGGPMQVAVALSPEGAVAGVRVLAHAETPGFADILDGASEWLAGFRQGDVDAVTGATVTSNAVRRAVAAAVARHRPGLCP